MKRSTLLLVSSLMILMFQNCGQNVDFKTQSETVDLSSTGGDDNIPNSTPGPEYSEQFKVAFNSEAAPLDMMWVIDNSGSMDAEAEAVRTNFDAFLKALNMSTNFRLLLVTTTNLPKNGVRIPSSFNSATHLQVDREVGSWNGPKALVEEIDKLPSGFLRANSKKIIVFVTDDNARTHTADSFMDVLISEQKWSKEDISVSSFIGLGLATSPCQAAEGAVYKDLASMTKGKNYNVCDPDWSSAFSDLIDESVSKAVRRFTLTKAPSVKEILEVRVGGKLLSKNLYSLSGKVLTLADSVELAENSQVSILYK